MKWMVAAALRALLLGLLWVFLAGWDADYAAYGAVSVLAAVTLSLVLLPPRGAPQPGAWPRRLWAAVGLALWFLGQSVRGGVDVALRALKRPADIEPTVIEAGFDLAPGGPRQLAMAMMNLMPGSMVQRVVAASGAAADETAEGPVEEPRYVELHTLSAALRPAEQWAQLQHRVGRAFR